MKKDGCTSSAAPMDFPQRPSVTAAFDGPATSETSRNWSPIDRYRPGVSGLTLSAPLEPHLGAAPRRRTAGHSGAAARSTRCPRSSRLEPGCSDVRAGSATAPRADGVTYSDYRAHCSRQRPRRRRRTVGRWMVGSAGTRGRLGRRSWSARRRHSWSARRRSWSARRRSGGRRLDRRSGGRRQIRLALSYLAENRHNLRQLVARIRCHYGCPPFCRSEH